MTDMNCNHNAVGNATVDLEAPGYPSSACIDRGSVVPIGPLYREVPLEVIQVVEKIAQAVEQRRPGGPCWKIAVEVDGERVALIERDVRGLRVLFLTDEAEG